MIGMLHLPSWIVKISIILGGCFSTNNWLTHISTVVSPCRKSGHLCGVTREAAAKGKDKKGASWQGCRFDPKSSRQTLVFFQYLDPAAGTICGGLFPEMYYVDKSLPPSDSTNKSMRFGKMGDFLAEFVTGEMNMKMKPLNFQNFQISSLSHLPFIN